jgi:hypothetical protein
MSRKVIYNWPVIQILTKEIPLNQLKNIIKEFSPNQIQSIAEISINILYGNLAISETQKDLLKPYKKVLIYLSGENHTLKNKQVYISRNLTAVKQIIKSASKQMSSILKEHYEQDPEKSDSTLGEVSSTSQE